jgi:hypothetical protein
MVKQGAQIARHDGTKEAAQKLVNTLIKKPAFVLKITHKLVEKGLRFDQTDAGKMVNEGLQALNSNTKAELASINEQLVELAKQREKDALQAKEDKAKLMKELKEERERNERLIEDTAKAQRHLKQKLESRPPIYHHIPGRVASTSRIQAAFGIICWLIETLFKVQRFLGPPQDDIFKFWTFINWLYWIPFTYLFYAAGPTALPVFIVACHALYRLICIAMIVSRTEEQKKYADVINSEKKRANQEVGALVLANSSERYELSRKKQELANEQKRLEKKERKIERWADDLEEREYRWYRGWR